MKKKNEEVFERTYDTKSIIKYEKHNDIVRETYLVSDNGNVRLEVYENNKLVEQVNLVVICSTPL